MKTKTDNLFFSMLSSPCDYSETADLIYGTDPYIYRDLFGNAENARKILAYSFENINSVFYKKAVYIIKNRLNGEVVGTALLHTKDFSWNPDIMLFDFEKAGIIVPESFSAVSEYMVRTYNYRKIGCSVCNISVKKNYQRKGVGSFMLNKLLELAKGEIMELTVLCTNIAAIKLYEKVGFEIIGDAFKDYGGFGEAPVECYKMVLNRF